MPSKKLRNNLQFLRKFREINLGFSENSRKSRIIFLRNLDKKEENYVIFFCLAGKFVIFTNIRGGNSIILTAVSHDIMKCSND